MKQGLYFSVLLLMIAFIITACKSSAPPEDADVAILFTEEGCELLKAPEGEVSNPVRIAMKNPTDKLYAVMIFSLWDGYDQTDLEEYTSLDLPFFVARFNHMDPKPKGDWLIEEYELDPDKENYFVCVQEERGLLSVPLALTP